MYGSYIYLNVYIQILLADIPANHVSVMGCTILMHLVVSLEYNAVEEPWSTPHPSLHHVYIMPQCVNLGWANSAVFCTLSMHRWATLAAVSVRSPQTFSSDPEICNLTTTLPYTLTSPSYRTFPLATAPKKSPSHTALRGWGSCTSLSFSIFL